MERHALDQARRSTIAETAREGVAAELQALKAELEHRVDERTAQLRTANEDLRAYGAALAHDLRTPLNAVLGFASLLELDDAGSLSDDQRRRVGLIRQGAQRMGELIVAMLALSGGSQQLLIVESVDLSALAGEVAAALALEQPQRCVQWDIEAGLVADGDRVLLRSVIENLFGNAWKYSAGSTTPRIGMSASNIEDGRRVYCVSDNGIGFEMLDAQGLFVPFRRLRSAAGFAGIGIGLSTVRRIVERHGGSVWAESRAGGPTRFFFTLGHGAADRASPQAGG